jgi:hypothetical protein
VSDRAIVYAPRQQVSLLRTRIHDAEEVAFGLGEDYETGTVWVLPADLGGTGGH